MISEQVLSVPSYHTDHSDLGHSPFYILPFYSQVVFLLRESFKQGLWSIKHPSQKRKQSKKWAYNIKIYLSKAINYETERQFERNGKTMKWAQSQKTTEQVSKLKKS